MDACTLCKREGDSSHFEDHHLYPGKHRRKEVGRSQDTIRVCRACGDQIHKMFDNNTLRTQLDSAEALRTAMHSFIAWVQKKPLEAAINMKTKKRRL